MRASLLLRLAAVVALVQFLAHATLFVTYSPSHGPAEAQLVDAMKSHVFAFSGVQRSYWDMYFGYGLFSAFNCLLESAVLWLVANQVGRRLNGTMPIVAAFAVANVVYTVLIWKYFFALPGYFDIALVVLLTWVLVSDRINATSTPVAGESTPFA